MEEGHIELLDSLLFVSEQDHRAGFHTHRMPGGRQGVRFRSHEKVFLMNSWIRPWLEVGRIGASVVLMH